MVGLTRVFMQNIVKRLEGEKGNMYMNMYSFAWKLGDDAVLSWTRRLTGV
jgi:hypothetical protein